MPWCGHSVDQIGYLGMRHYHVEACDVLGNFPDFAEFVVYSVWGDFLLRMVLRNQCDHLCRALGVAHTTTQLKEHSRALLAGAPTTCPNLYFNHLPISVCKFWFSIFLIYTFS